MAFFKYACLVNFIVAVYFLLSGPANDPPTLIRFYGFFIAAWICLATWAVLNAVVSHQPLHTLSGRVTIRHYTPDIVEHVEQQEVSKL